MDVKENVNSMHQDHTEQAIGQMPKIARPHPFDLTAIGELSKNGVDAVAHAPQDGTPTVRWLMFSRAIGGNQGNVAALQRFLQARQPVVAIAQQLPLRAFAQIQHDLAFMHVGRCQSQLGNDPWQAQTHMQAKAVKGLARRMIFAIARLALEAMAAIGPRELADGNGHTIHNGNARIVGQHLITDTIHNRSFTFHRLVACRTKVVRCTCCMAGKKCA